MQLKQYSRRNNNELKRMPFIKTEDLIKTIQQIASCLQVELNQDIEAIHRAQQKDRAMRPTNIVKSMKRSTIDRIVKAAKRNRINVTMLGLESDKPVYINEHLCPEYKVLLGKSIQAKPKRLAICMGLRW